MHVSRTLVLLLLGITLSSSVRSQIYFTNISSVWDDKMDEWTIVGIDSNDYEVEYTLSLTWPLRNNWEEWRITGSDITATIKTKWKGDISQWEFRSSNEIILIRQQFRGDPSQWELRQGSQRIAIRTVYRNNANDWIRVRKSDDWHMFTEFIDDPRDWIIEDFSDDDLSVSFRLAMIFTALWQSIPKA